MRLSWDAVWTPGLRIKVMRAQGHVYVVGDGEKVSAEG